MTKRTILSITSFFLMAFGLTFLISQLPTIMFFSVDLKDILCGFGPLISGLICYQLFKTTTTYSIGGTQPLKAWLIVIISATTYILTNSKNGFGMNVFMAATQIIYCFGEEFGWRHYLQSATNDLNKWLQSFIIGLVWFGWHFSWLQEPIKAMTGQNMDAPLTFIIICAIIALSLLSSLLGSFMKKTHSILLPTILHFAVKSNIPTLIVALTLIIITIVTWDKFYIGKKLVVDNRNAFNQLS